MFQRLLLLGCLMWGHDLIAQYRGGSNDGFASAAQITLNALPDIYKGGSNDGFSFNSSINQNTTPNIYAGGTNDGFSLVAVGNQNSTPNIYAGGINDGFSFVSTVNQNLTPGIYTGGINDGFSSIVVNAQNFAPNIYLGGTNDGFDQDIAVLQNSTPNIYTGGVNDGWATIIVISQNQAVVVAVRLTEFNAVWQRDDVLVSWKTSSERDNDHFEIERSIDYGASYQKIGTVNGSGTTTTTKHYSFLDTDVKSQTGTVFYYRLKSVATDGLFAYSAIAKLSRKEKEITYILYPNPGDGRFNLQLKGVNELKGYSYQVYSEKGELLQNGLLQTTTTGFDLSRLPAASYWMRIIKDGKIQTTIRVILIK